MFQIESCAKADTPSEVFPVTSVMWCRHGLVHIALKNSGTGLYITFVNFKKIL